MKRYALFVKRYIIWVMKIEILKYKIRKNINKYLDRFFNKYKFTFLFRPINTELLILDDFFPCQLSNFRYIEFSEYLQNYNSTALTTGKSLPNAQIYKSINYFIKLHPSKNRIKVFQKNRLIKAKLAVLVFQHNTVQFLDYLENNRIPFIFTLYPGGNFILNDKNGDLGLSRIFNSIYFRKVIVTQKITLDYLLDNKLCKAENIEFIYGCPIETKNDNFKKNPFELVKKEINICFVAAKYHPTGMDKGYDVFIDTAKKLQKSSSKFKFHVVGGFDKNDINIENIESNIKFYGYLEINALRKFYEKMDIIISPNRSNVLANGAFDGFPTAAVVEAGLKGVIMMLTDDNNQNIYFKNGEDCVFINHNSVDISNKVIELCNDTFKMNYISNSCQNKLNNLFSYDSQIKKRFEIIDTLIKQK